MEKERPVLRGIDSKERLQQWFEATGHRNLVLRIVDVIELREPVLQRLIQICSRFKGPVQVEFKPKGQLLAWWPGGYVVLPIKQLMTMLNLPELQILQQVCYEYHEIRLGKGFPVREDPCLVCEGGGRVRGNRDCGHCDGTGKIVTFLEVSEEEDRLAKEEA